MTKEQMTAWIESIRADLKSKEEYRGLDEDSINEMIMDGMYEGFLQGELHRYELKEIADYLGFEMDDEFMNDPHPDPIDLKKGSNK